MCVALRPNLETGLQLKPAAPMGRPNKAQANGLGPRVHPFPAG